MRMVNMDANHALSGKEQLYCGGAWVPPSAGNYEETFNPGTGQLIGLVAAATRAEVDVAPACLKEWRDVAPLERASILQEIAALLHKRGDELSMMDAANCGNPYTEMRGDAAIAAAQMEFFAGLVTEMKGDTIPMGPDRVNMTLRQPLSVVAR